jgi:hypothetical protein
VGSQLPRRSCKSQTRNAFPLQHRRLVHAVGDGPAAQRHDDPRLPDTTPDWRGEALQFLVEQAASFDGQVSVEWHRRDRVVVKPEGKRAAFFLQVRDDEFWWFRAEFRTEKGRFDQADLARKLKLRSWNDVPERQVYGGWSRVRLTARQKRWDHVTLFLWDRSEMESPAFRRFLRDCWKGYQVVLSAAGGRS